MSSESEIITCEDLKVSLSRLIDLHNKFKSLREPDQTDVETTQFLSEVKKVVSSDEVLLKILQGRS